ncbi:MAG TPA: sensor histidine kinase N-terminal domain-containing protein [Rubrivivax sp.]|nr:sensor histidine kinase N-terminal domain-containing protein [Rubrivivax sp.]HPO20733.1 sensor histidine kinase N-terminal domain-containing protein [Rubrivivax sp.]
MTLQRRVMLFLLASAPLVWALGLAFGLRSANLEINELFDTQQLQLARQVMALLPSLPPQMEAQALPQAPGGAKGAADEDDLSIAVWDRSGRLLLADREGVQLPYRGDGGGFVDHRIDGRDWRLYYLREPSGEWLVAVGQQRDERDELVQALLAGQLLPWVLTLPALLLVMAAALRQALQPLRRLGEELRQRRALELQPLHDTALPDDLKPLVQALNALLARVREQIEHERRFTADAAHELRTPLAALQAQWDTAQLEAARAGHAATPAQAKVGEGLARLSRLVTQMLALARLEHLDAPAQRAAIDWSTLVEQLFGELLPLAETRQAELECQWPPRGEPPLLVHGDSALLTLMLRNLLDNALRHSPPHGRVTLRLAADAIEVIDHGPGVPDELLPRLGDRFFRLPGQAHAGSGLGLSIATRIAALHGLVLQARRDSGVFVMRVSPA